MANISINEVRAKYPDYNDMSDQQLADKLHAKYYSDMPKSDFYSKVGLQAGSGSQPMTDEQKQQKMQELQYITGSNRTPFDTIRDVGAGVIEGLGKGGQFIGSQMEKIPGFQKLQQSVQGATGISVPPVNFDQLVAPIASQNKSIGGNLAQGIGEYLPYALAGGASIPGQLAAGAAHGAATTPQGDTNMFGLLPNGPVGGAIKGAGLNLIGAGAGKLLEALRPSKMFRGTLSPEELQANARAAQGTETDIGNVIGSPLLQRQYENVLAKAPMSGAVDTMQRTGQAVEKRGENVLSNVLGVNSPENVTDQVHEALLKQFDAHQTVKNDMYTEANNLADQTGLKLELPNFAKKANEYSDAIDSTNMLKFEPDMAKIFNKLKNYKNPVQQSTNTGAIIDQSGNPLINETTTTYPTLKEANLLKGKLNNYAQMAGKSPDPAQRNMARVFGDLASSLKGDIQSTIDQSGAGALKTAYNQAEENYAKNFSPFLDRDIYKFLNGKADPDTIVQSFLKTGQVDRGRSLAKLTSKLTPDEQRLIAYSYLSRAVDNEGNLNPAKLATLVGKLGKNQFKTLIPDADLRNQLTDYRKLYKMNTKAVNTMHNPPTGQQVMDLITKGAGAMGGNMLLGPVGALAGWAAPGLASRGLVKAMTNEGTRGNMIKAMIENKPKFTGPVKSVATSSLAQGLANLMGNRNK